MGVTQLWQILAPVRIHKTLSELEGLTLAVDLSIWVCETQGVKPMQGVVSKPFLRNLFFRVSHLTQLGVKLVFVVEGEAPELKWEAMLKRQQARFPGQHAGKNKGSGKTSRRNFKSCLKECCEMLSILGVPYLQSKGEAEAFCAVLNEAGVVDGCLTDDGDAFLYGARTVYRNFTMNAKDPHVESYSMVDVETTLGLDRKKLVGLALLLGCDYLPKGVPGVGPEKAIKMMRLLENVDILKRFKDWITGGQCFDLVEENVRKKALAVSDFPQQKIIDEFMIVKDKCPRSIEKWKRPMSHLFQLFAAKKLEWPEEYSLEKLLCLLTLWDMLSIKDTQVHQPYYLVPHRIVKIRIRQGVQCYEIEWHKEGDVAYNKDYYVTIEEQGLFTECFPKCAEDFQQSLAEKKEKRRGKPKKKVATQVAEPVSPVYDTTNDLTSQLQNMTLCVENEKHKITDSQYREAKDLCDSIVKQTENQVSLDCESEIEQLPLSQRIQRKIMGCPQIGSKKSECTDVMFHGLDRSEKCSSVTSIADGAVSKYDKMSLINNFPAPIGNEATCSHKEIGESAYSKTELRKHGDHRKYSSLDTRPEVFLERRNVGLTNITENEYEENEVFQSQPNYSERNTNVDVYRDNIGMGSVDSKIQKVILNVKSLHNRNMRNTESTEKGVNIVSEGLTKITENEYEENEVFQSQPNYSERNTNVAVYRDDTGMGSVFSRTQKIVLNVKSLHNRNRRKTESTAKGVNIASEGTYNEIPQVILDKDCKQVETWGIEPVSQKKPPENVLSGETCLVKQRNNVAIQDKPGTECLEIVSDCSLTNEFTELKAGAQSSRLLSLNFESTPDSSDKSATKIVIDTPTSPLSLQKKNSTPGQDKPISTLGGHYQTVFDFGHVDGLDSTVKTPNMSAVIDLETLVYHQPSHVLMKNVPKFNLCDSPDSRLKAPTIINVTNQTMLEPVYDDHPGHEFWSSRCHLPLANAQDSPLNGSADISQADNISEYGEFNLESSLMKSLNGTNAFMYTRDTHDKSYDSPSKLIQSEQELFQNEKFPRRAKNIMADHSASDSSVILKSTYPHSSSQLRHSYHGNQKVLFTDVDFEVKFSGKESVGALSNIDSDHFDIAGSVAGGKTPSLNKLVNRPNNHCMKGESVTTSPNRSKHQLDTDAVLKKSSKAFGSKAMENSPVSLVDRLRSKLVETSMKSALGAITGKTDL